MKGLNKLELTLAIIKPHVVKNPIVLKKIREIIINNNFKIIKSQRKIMTPNDANAFYADHKEKFFFNRLFTFMCSGPSDIHILARENAISKWRQIMGPTKVFYAQYSHPQSIRGKYGLTDTRNATHGSDSQESAEREMNIFFHDFDTLKWIKEEENYFRNEKIKLDTELFVHKIYDNNNHNNNDDDV
ncbi:hypothetical protein HCN44_009783 [Aphidius gifuensis]|uniref:Nucleoside diphosphate kinase-like domain-containing protein n=1 Tax=Aphidius gifuensis TaxID=684658 RepID=A0A834Y2W9_APHGI|nr:nucleoside diphosphate kinase 6 [Aphidius gifuensis]KAF7998385.1 hypothetical protein HCN44_009783 [Aphidius gifuensis]